MAWRQLTKVQWDYLRHVLPQVDPGHGGPFINEKRPNTARGSSRSRCQSPPDDEGSGPERAPRTHSLRGKYGQGKVAHFGHKSRLPQERPRLKGDGYQTQSWWGGDRDPNEHP